MRLLNQSVFSLVAVACLAFSSGIANSQTAQSKSVLKICLADSEPTEGWAKHDVEGQEPIYVNPQPVIREDDIESVEAKAGEASGSKSIYIKLTRGAGKKMSAASGANLNKPMAILFNGAVVSAPKINSKIDRDIMITGNFSDAQIDEMLEALQPRPRVAVFDDADLEKFSARMDRAFEKRIFNGTVLIAVEG